MAEDTDEDIQVVTSTPTLSKEEVERTLMLNAQNVIRKAESGKPLTMSEQNLLQQYLRDRDGGELEAVDGWAPNIVSLASALKVDRRTIQRWMKQEGNPGHRSDGRYSIPEWRDWCTSNGLKVDAPEPTQADMKVEEIRLRNQKTKLQLEILEKNYVPVELLEQWAVELAMEVRKQVCKLHLLAPSIVGVSTEAADAILRDKETDILNSLHQLSRDMANWKKSDGKSSP